MGRASKPHRARIGSWGKTEVATVFVGCCPECGDIPDGKWFDGSDFQHWCGATILATLFDGKDGAGHWKFRLESRPGRTKREQ